MNEKKYLTLEEAEKIVDDMYQKRWEQCGVEEGNTIHMGNLDNLEYNELEKASILLLRTELRLKRENKQLKERINNAIEYIEKNPLYYEQYDYNYDDELELVRVSSEQAENDLLEILKINKGLMKDE